jgi:N-methylhydantoinase A
MVQFSSLPLIGVDTGGTFTDLVMVDNGVVHTWKLPSTPADPAAAVIQGVKHLAGENPALVFHGSTVATNALLEGKGARLALVVTLGFRDLLLIGRQNRPELYALHPQRKAPLVPPERTIEARERVLAGGVVEIPLSAEQIGEIVTAVKGTGANSVAICLLHSYSQPAHETLLAQALEAEGFDVSASSRILPEFREFERASTTVVNAAVSPVMGCYLEKLQSALAGRPLRIMQSNGGAIRPEVASREAVRTILSGPAGGMVGALASAQRAGVDHIITFDMGGTSTDVGLCAGEIPFTSEALVAGWPVRIPMIDIHTVGAGGGSIARLDAGGALRVGPESAGADPGPACYGRGEEATVTDANLFLGRLLPESFLGGRMPLYPERARSVVERLAEEAGLSSEKAAEGIVEVAEATMAAALRLVSVARGYDPRDFVLLPFGGAGGLHACALAEELGMRRILIPPGPGLLSAFGLVVADTIRDYSQSVLRPGSTSNETLEELYLPLEERARQEMKDEGAQESAIALSPTLDMRYRGQSFEVNIPFCDDFRRLFHRRHEVLYGYRDEAGEIEIVTLRLRARVPGLSTEFGHRPPEGEMTPLSESAMRIDGELRISPVYRRESLPSGSVLEGPVLIVEETATHLVRPGWRARVDPVGNVMLERTSPSQAPYIPAQSPVKK